MIYVHEMYACYLLSPPIPIFVMYHASHTTPYITNIGLNSFLLQTNTCYACGPNHNISGSLIHKSISKSNSFRNFTSEHPQTISFQISHNNLVPEYTIGTHQYQISFLTNRHLPMMHVKFYSPYYFIVLSHSSR